MSAKATSNVDRSTFGGGRAAVEVAVVDGYGSFLAAALNAIGRRRRGLSANARRDEATEAVQEAIGRALAKADECRADRSAVAWVMGFVFRVCAERCRKSAREARLAAAEQRVDVDDLPGKVPIPLVAEDEGQRFEVALTCLRPTDREVLELLRVEDLSSHALARRLGLPTDGAARVARHRAVKAVKAACSRLAAEQRDEVIP